MSAREIKEFLCFHCWRPMITGWGSVRVTAMGAARGGGERVEERNLAET